MRLRPFYFKKIQDFMDFLHVYLGRSCAGTLDDDSFVELFNRVEALFGDLEFIDIKTLMK